jgi:hypothetical protein
LHWLEDAYGREDWPITGRLVTKPNILHHHDPRYFTRYGWFHSSWDLMCLGLLILAVAWLFGVLTWQVWLFAILGSTANQIHKWAHRTPSFREFACFRRRAITRTTIPTPKKATIAC